MRIRVSASGVRGSTTVEVWTPAKLNLFLEILSKRSDGFHEIETLMAPIGIYDTLTFRETFDEQLDLTCDWSWRPRESHGVWTRPVLPAAAENIVVRSLRLLRDRAGVRRGASLRLVKRIPMAAGLAGGSSDAAAALVAANVAWQLNWPRERLAEVAAEIGSDVPFFLGAGLTMKIGQAVCRGRGERIEPLPTRGGLHFVVARPPAGLATAEVYQACRPAEQPRSVASLVDALRRGRVDRIGRLLHNRLQQAAAGLSPWVARLEQEFSSLDVCGARMSGSGTSWFGLCRDARHARRVASRLRARNVAEVFAVRGV
jgi:4-diphosphocytidyl-2-C-methyl-D-erythritol kinase